MWTQEQIDALDSSRKKKMADILRRKGHEYNVHPLSSGQERMWFLYRLDPDSPYYNASYVIALTGELQVAALERTLHALVRRHEILRTVYFSLEGEPWQSVLPEAECPLRYADLSRLPEDVKADALLTIKRKEKNRPFDLTRDLPLRAWLVRLDERSHELILTLHHIAHDGWSLGVLLRDFRALYRAEAEGGEAPPPPAMQYADYAHWQRNFLRSELCARQLEYWTGRLKDAADPFPLPQDGAGGGRHAGAMAAIALPAEVCRKLRALAGDAQASLFAALLTVYCMVLYRYTGQKDLSVGTPAANRNQPEFGETVGFFANTLVLRTELGGELSFLDCLERVKRTVLDAFARQEVPFDRLVEALGIERDPETTPLFRTVFALHNEALIGQEAGGGAELPGLSVRFRTLGEEALETVQFDLVVTATEQPDGIELTAAYRKDKYARERIVALLNAFAALAGAAADDPRRPVGELPLLTGGQQALLARDAADVPVDWPFPAGDDGPLLAPDPAVLRRPIRGRQARIAVTDERGRPVPPYFEGVIVIGEGDTYRRTGIRGYWTADGELKVTGTEEPGVFLDGAWMPLEEAEAVLLRDGSLHDVHLAPSRDPRHLIPCLMVYYVGDAEPPLRERIGSYVPLDIVPVRVHAIPRGEDGGPDTELLDRAIGAAARALKRENGAYTERDLLRHAAAGAPAEARNARIPLSRLLGAGTVRQGGERTDEAREPAVMEGPPLEELPVRTLGELLLRSAALYGDKRIGVIRPGAVAGTTIAGLARDAATLAAWLRRRGMRKGDPLIIHARDLHLVIRGLWACMLGGWIAVPIGATEDAAGLGKLVHVWEFLDGPLVLSDEAAARTLRSRLPEQAVRMAIEIPGDGIMPEADVACEPADEGDTALILFTSGSTGKPKGVQLTHRNILKRCQAAAAFNGFHSGDVSFNWMPLDHVGGIVMFHMLDIFTGADQYHAETGEILADPLRWLDWIDRLGATLTWAPNFAFALIVEREAEVRERRWNLERLRFILNAGEAIHGAIARKFMRMLAPKGLPAHAMNPAWGMTETSSAVTYFKAFADWREDQVPVGTPAGGTALRIVDENGTPKRRGETGLLEIRGETVTRGYFRNEEQNRESFTSDGWFRTGDLAVMDGNGITIVGRSKDVVIVNGLNYYCVELEHIIEQTGLVSLGCTCVCPYRPEVAATESAVVFYVPADAGAPDALVRERIRDAVFTRAGLWLDYFIRLEREDIPRTSIGKIQRNTLARRLAEGEWNAVLERETERTRPDHFVPDWFYTLRWAPARLRSLKPQWPDGTVLLFGDGGMRADGLAAQLRSRNVPCVIARPDARWRPLDGGFGIDPATEADYDRLLREIEDRWPPVRWIVHAWSHDEIRDIDEAQQRGVLSLSRLIRAAHRRGWTGRRLSLTVVTSGVFRVLDDDPVEAAKGTLIGFLRTASLELPDWTIRHVDLDARASGEEADFARLVLREWQEPGHGEQAAWRGGIRYRPFLAKREMKAEEADAARGFRDGGVYAVAGGLGGIGHELCRHLLTAYNARLILIGRTDPEDGGSGAKRERLRALRSLGEVCYIRADISRPGAFAEAVRAGERQLGRRIDGIIHLAGEGQLLRHWQSADRYRIVSQSDDVFRGMFAAKVHGTRHMLDFAEQRGGLDVLLFSSISALFGAGTFSAYAAANSGMEQEARARGDRVDVRCIAWSVWDNLGMSEGNPEEAADVSRRMGYRLIPPGQGLLSLEAVIRRGDRHIIVGIDGANVQLQRRMPGPEWLPAPDDEKRDADTAREEAAGDQAPDGIEAKLREIWRDVLGHDRFGSADKFFEAGGNSIKVMRLMSLINGAFGVNLQIADLFKYNTVRSQVKAIADLNGSIADPGGARGREPDAADKTAEIGGLMF